MIRQVFQTGNVDVLSETMQFNALLVVNVDMPLLSDGEMRMIIEVSVRAVYSDIMPMLRTGKFQHT